MLQMTSSNRTSPLTLGSALELGDICVQNMHLGRFISSDIRSEI